MDLAWRFAPNNMGEVEGPNNPGISSFTNDRPGGLVREFIQNSIDAQASKKHPVIVEFEIRCLSIDNLDLIGLRKALVASCKSPDNDDRHRRQFKRGLQQLDSALEQRTIQVLTITDRHTTGAPDEDGRKGKWHILTKSVGLSAKDAKDAGGSFGIGKHAAFALADLRTVLYATSYRKMDDSKEAFEHRFTGKSILVSHDIGCNSFRATGWLEGKRGGSLQNNDVPRTYRLSNPGTQVTILGFSPDSLEKWEKDIRETVIFHFFHALVHSNLQVKIGGEWIDANNVDEWASFMTEKRIQDFIDVSRSEVLAYTEIRGIGRVNLRIATYKEGQGKGKEIALVRDAGMMITKRLGNMLLSPSQKMIRSIPRRWNPFLAVVECLSEGQKSLLREAEGPRHDGISPDNADADEQTEVRVQLGELGKWIWETIEKHAKPQEIADSENANEMASFVPLKSRSGEASSELGQGEFIVTNPQQSTYPPRGLGMIGKGRGRTQRPGTGKESPDLPPPPPPPPPPHARKRKLQEKENWWKPNSTMYAVYPTPMNNGLIMLLNLLLTFLIICLNVFAFMR